MRAHCLGDVITYGMTQPVTSRRWDDRRSDAARSDPCFIMATVAGGRRDTRGVLWDTPRAGSRAWRRRWRRSSAVVCPTVRPAARPAAVWCRQLTPAGRPAACSECFCVGRRLWNAVWRRRRGKWSRDPAYWPMTSSRTLSSPSLPSPQMRLITTTNDS